MAALMRSGPALLLIVFLAALPTTAAQAPTTTLTLTATPSGGWEADGLVDAGLESPMWRVNATTAFSNTAVCADNVEVKLELLDVPTQTMEGSVVQNRTTVDVPTGGGNRGVAGEVNLRLSPATPGGEPFNVRLHGRVAGCGSPLGTSPKAETNLTLSITPKLVPAIRVDYDNRSASGVFNFTVRNDGNGALLVGASVTPVEGAPDQPVNPPDGLSLGPGEFTVFTLVFSEKKPGRYEVLVTGSFNGPGADQQPRGEFTARIEIPAPTIVRQTKNAPGLEIAGALAAVAVAFGRRRI